MLFTSIIGLVSCDSDDDDSTPDGVVAVDLGLPSGTLWANMNVGAKWIEDYGDYFAWGETRPKDVYDWSTYKWANGSYDTLTKYCTMSYRGTVDNKTILDLEDDAAHANWGGGWRIPTLYEIDELLNNTIKEWTTQNGVVGRKFISKVNGNSIFLPHSANYWSSTLAEEEPHRAYSLESGPWYADSDYDVRSRGLSVRPVRH